jgi:hypothetical protein
VDFRLTTLRPAELANDFDLNQGSALLDEVEAARGGVRKVNDAVAGRVAAGQREPVIDRHADGLSISEIGHAHFRAAAKFGMRCGQLRRSVRPATRGFVPFE